MYSKKAEKKERTHNNRPSIRIHQLPILAHMQLRRNPAFRVWIAREQRAQRERWRRCHLSWSGYLKAVVALVAARLG